MKVIMNKKLKQRDAMSMCAINFFKAILPNTTESYSTSVLYLMKAKTMAYSVMAITIGINIPMYQTSM